MGWEKREPLLLGFGSVRVLLQLWKSLVRVRFYVGSKNLRQYRHSSRVDKAQLTKLKFITLFFKCVRYFPFLPPFPFLPSTSPVSSFTPPFSSHIPFSSHMPFSSPLYPLLSSPISATSYTFSAEKRHPSNPTMGSGERCKLPQRGPGGRQRIFVALEPRKRILYVDSIFGYLRLQKKWNFKCGVNAWDFNRRPRA